MRNGPIAMPNVSSAPSTCAGDAPSSTRNIACRRYCSSIRLPMKPSHTPDTTAVLPMRLASCITVASTSARRCGAAHDLEQLHHVRRAEEVHADDVLRALRRRGDPVDVERRRVGREDRAGLRDAVERREHLSP